MRILVLNGSPRSKGNTKQMVEAFRAGAEAAGHQVDVADVCRMKINGCLACEYCHTKGNGTCIQKDDMQTIYELLKEAEMLVIASPIYYHGVSGQLKCVLDRFYSAAYPRKPKNLKKVAMILSSGDADMYDGAMFSYQGDFLDYLGLENTALSQSTNFKAFELRLKDMGYEIRRDERFAHYSVKASDWQRAIRLDRLGKEYTPQAIRERLLGNQRYVGYVPFQKPKCAPLLTLEIEYRRMMRMNGIQVLFALVIELCRLITGNNITKDTPRPLSPAMRQEVVKLDRTMKEYKFLCENHIDSPQELVSFISEKREQISALERERQSIYNRNRHKKSEELNAEARAISAKIKPLREELSLAKAVMEKIPKLKEVLETERQAEAAVLTKNKERRYAR